MAQEIKARFRRKGDELTVKMMLPHPMETGTRKDEQDNVIPAHYIETVSCTLNGRPVLNADFSGSVSTDPILTFYVNGVKAGDEVTVAWTDNKGESMTRTDTLK
jgi:sulfur-oxidizing protein SoxZ